MEVLCTVLYVSAGIVLVVALGCLVGRWRSRKVRPGHEGPDPRLLEAQRRFEAGEITDSELRRIEERILRG